MLLPQEAAFDILGLPTFATTDDIILRYKALALMSFPEKHSNRTLALQEFTNISEAAVTLVFPDKKRIQTLSLSEMYGFFQYMFFGKGGVKEEENCDIESDIESECSLTSFVEDAVTSEIKAARNAQKLIMEEEHEKSKVDKRKAKKKRRKERRRLERIEKETSPDKKNKGTSTNDVKKEVKKENSTVLIADKTKKIQETQLSESEEEIDTSSAFVLEAMKKKKNVHIEEKIEEKPRHKNPNIPPESPESIMLRSQAIAARGNELARLGHFSVAAELFTESIKLYPDYRFYGNRSFCYDCLCLYDKALKDAERAIVINPEWAKGYFRKGRALFGLKKYSEAEHCFVEVLKLDPECEEAVSELHTLALRQLMEKGYSKEHAEMAIENYGNVEAAIIALEQLAISKNVESNHADIFESDDECDAVWKGSAKTIPPHLYDIKRDPQNPEGHNSIWIGNVQPSVTEKTLIAMFSKFGEMLSIKVMPEKFCAFINYKNKSSPGKAMQIYQGFEIGGTHLIIRFPHLPGETPIKKKAKVHAPEAAKKQHGPINDNECYFWRTTGCVYAAKCRYKHIKAHKGIDKQKWQVS